MYQIIYLKRSQHKNMIKINRSNTCLEKEDAEAYGKLYRLQKENLSFSATPNLKLIFFFGVQSHVAFIE